MHLARCRRQAHTDAMSATGSIAERPAFLVHGLEQARAACIAAAAAGRAITLLSAPGCAQYAGIGWFQALIDQARDAAPGADVAAILDCGDAAGRAQQALTHGLSCLVVDPACPALPRLRDLAARHGATILTKAPAAIDLGLAADPAAACRAALEAEPQH